MRSLIVMVLIEKRFLRLFVAMAMGGFLVLFGTSACLSTSSSQKISKRVVPLTGVELLVAIGKMERTVVSCDGGKNWIHDRSMDDQARCWFTGGPECDHHPGSGMGVAFGEGSFVATFGWGSAGPVLRTENGRDWNRTERTYSSTGPAAGMGRFVAFGFNPFISLDSGATWLQNFGVYIEPNPRQVYFTEQGGGTFMMYASGGSPGVRAIWRSTDGGETFTQSDYAQNCGSNLYALAQSSNRLVAIPAWSEIPCISSDAGITWSRMTEFQSVLGTDQLRGTGLYRGEELLVFGQQGVYVSLNHGITWAKYNYQKPFSGPLWLSHVTALSNGDLVAVHQDWGHYYQDQHFLRSVDGGRTWLLADHYHQGHPITAIRVGRVERAICEE